MYLKEAHEQRVLVVGFKESEGEGVGGTGEIYMGQK